MTGAPARARFAALSVSQLLVRVIVAILLLVVLVFAYQAVRAGLALRDAESTAAELKQQLTEGDQRAADRSLREIAAASRTAHGHTDNLLWDAAAHLPLLGDDVAAIQVISQVLDETSSAAFPPALRLSSALTSQELRSADGRFDLEEIAGLAPEFGLMEKASDQAATELDGVETARLFSPLARATTKLEDQVQSLRSLARAGDTAAHLVPAMLGDEEPRSYLLVVQNNAEIRSTGGLPGSISILNAEDGKLSLGAQRSGLDFPILDEPVLPLTRSEVDLYGNTLGEDIRDTNLTPDFPRAAALMSAMYEREYDEEVDGVISVDPIALSGVLAAIGPIEVRGDTFNQDNVVSQLLSRPYEQFDDQEAQNAYFAKAARGIFDALLTKQVDQPAVVRRLSEAGGQRRLLVWSSHDDEQERLSGTAVAGELPSETTGVAQVGMYLNDTTAAKMQYYLDYSASLSSVSCTEDGVQNLIAGMVLDSTAPQDVRGLSEWVTGFGKFAPKGSIAMNLHIYAPPGGSVTAIEANGERLKLATVEDDGREVAVVGLLLRAGEQIRLTARLTSGPDQRADPKLQVTPGIRTESSGETAPSTCT